VIEVRGERRGGGVRLAVTDEGPADEPRTSVPGANADAAQAARTGAVWLQSARARRDRRRRRRGLRIAREALEHAGGMLATGDLARRGRRPPRPDSGARGRTMIAIDLPASDVPLD